MLAKSLILVSLVALAGLSETVIAGEAPASLDEHVEHYDNRYALPDEYEKLTDNRGEGFDDLYGTRNFREILKGIAYRGGANNRFHEENRRDNMNPLPPDGLENLCKEGFGTAYYLYRTNFDSVSRQTHCTSSRTGKRTLEYFQLSPKESDHVHEMLQSIFDSIKDHRKGPVYLHCWNGWHASGLISAKVLRQFCGLSADEAVEYWDKNTDGHNSEPKYESIRQNIRDFQPFPDLAITSDEAALICP